MVEGLLPAVRVWVVTIPGGSEPVLFPRWQAAVRHIDTLRSAGNCRLYYATEYPLQSELQEEGYAIEQVSLAVLLSRYSMECVPIDTLEREGIFLMK